MTIEEIEARNEELTRAYRLTFGSPQGQIVLLDLMKLCKFRAPCDGQIDEGARRVFIRIMDFMNYTPEQLAATYQNRPQITGAGK